MLGQKQYLKMKKGVCLTLSWEFTAKLDPLLHTELRFVNDLRVKFRLITMMVTQPKNYPELGLFDLSSDLLYPLIFPV